MSSSDYSIKSRRCSICGINFPPYVAVCRVKKCGETTWANSKHGPDDDWSELVAMHDKRNADDEAPSVYPHHHDNSAKVYRDSGDRLWVTHEALLGNGYRAITEDTIVYLNEKFYELQVFAQKAGAWLLEEIVVDGAADSLEPSMFSGPAET